MEVEPNYEPGADRMEALELFVKSLANPETRNPRFNLRLRFRDRKMLQELGLDDGESLEFDLDIYKAEDQDIPDLLSSLVSEFLYCLVEICMKRKGHSIQHSTFFCML